LKRIGGSASPAALPAPPVVQEMAEVLLVSKPVSPPWNDSSKNLVRELAVNMTRHVPIVMSKRGALPELAGARIEAVYAPGSGRFAPALADNARVMLRLLAGRRAPLWHLFFAPNPLSSTMAALAARAKKARTVQTICSIPARDADLRSLLFADVSVAVSCRTERLLLEAGLRPDRVRRIPPAVSRVQPLGRERREQVRRLFDLPVDGPLLVYPGDLEVGQGADRALQVLADLPGDLDAHLAIACRAKTPEAREHEARLKNQARQLRLTSRVSWVGETTAVLELLAAADLVLFPVDDLTAKMDLPLVLIEAMSARTAVLLTTGTSAEELAEGGAGLAVVPERDAISQAVRGLLLDETERLGLADRGYRAVEERYRPQAMAAAYEQVYDELLG